MAGGLDLGDRAPGHRTGGAADLPTLRAPLESFAASMHFVGADAPELGHLPTTGWPSGLFAAVMRCCWSLLAPA